MIDNPMGREYTAAEWAAARRQGLRDSRDSGGPLIWATGPHHPDEARKNARDWALLADAMDREWQKPLPGEATP